MLSTPYQSHRIALERIARHEGDLIRAERERDWRYKKEEGDAWFAKEMASLFAWFDYLERKRREENLTGLGPDDRPGICPMSAPFPRYFAMLCDEAAGLDFCDEITQLFIEIALVVAVQKSIGVALGDHEYQLRRVLRARGPAVQSSSTSGGSSTAAAAVKPPSNMP